MLLAPSWLQCLVLRLVSFPSCVGTLILLLCLLVRSGYFGAVWMIACCFWPAVLALRPFQLLVACSCRPWPALVTLGLLWLLLAFACQSLLCSLNLAQSCFGLLLSLLACPCQPGAVLLTFGLLWLLLARPVTLDDCFCLVLNSLGLP